MFNRTIWHKNIYSCYQHQMTYFSNDCNGNWNKKVWYKNASQSVSCQRCDSRSERHLWTENQTIDWATWASLDLRRNNSMCAYTAKYHWPKTNYQLFLLFKNIGNNYLYHLWTGFWTTSQATWASLDCRRNNSMRTNTTRHDWPNTYYL